MRPQPNPVQAAPSTIVVAIPAMNEAERIGACLASLAVQEGAPPFQTVVLANNCTDATAAIARTWNGRLPDLHVIETTLPPEKSHAGEARRQAMNHAAALSTPDGVLLTTDADTCLPPDWIAANLAELANGVDAVAGRALIDPIEARSIPRHLHELDALECRYAALLDEITALIAPEPYDPWPRHDEHSGASIAVRLAAFRAAGGIPCLPSGEDRAFFAALRRIGAQIRHAPHITVIVSGRLDGRAPGGMAETIRARIAKPPEWLDDRLEPVNDVLRRLSAAQTGSVAAIQARARRTAHPNQTPGRVSFAEVDGQIATATAIRDLLRAEAADDFSPADPADTPRFGPDGESITVPRTQP